MALHVVLVLYMAKMTPMRLVSGGSESSTVRTAACSGSISVHLFSHHRKGSSQWIPCRAAEDTRRGGGALGTGVPACGFCGGKTWWREICWSPLSIADTEAQLMAHSIKH